MAFNSENFVPVSAMANSNASRIFSYTTADDALAAIKAASYFDAAAAVGGYGLTDGDVILAEGTDGTSFLKIAVAAGVATTASAADFA